MNKIEIINGKVWCPKCCKNKNISEFYSFLGRPKRPCKECKLQYQGSYYQENKEEIEIYRQNYYQQNKEEIISNQLKRDTARKDDIAAYQIIYRQENKIELARKKQEYRKIKTEIDPSYKLRGLISNAIFQSLKNMGSNKGGKSILKYLEYNINELKFHLENQFEYWMNWNNWGIYDIKTWNDEDRLTWKWQIDHIIPQSKLLYTSMEDDNFKKCWTLENLRPLSAKINLIDGNRR